MSSYFPSVTETDDRGIERVYDLPSRLLNDRIILLEGEVNDTMASSIIAQLLFLDSQNHNDITIYINSPGGTISSGLAIYDVINHIKSPVSTVCIGMAASMAAFLLCSGSYGKRFCLPNSTVMIHQPLGGAQGQATDIEIVANRILRIKKQLYEIISMNTGKTYDEIYAACERDNYLTPEEALKFGLIDKILESKPKAVKQKIEEEEED